MTIAISTVMLILMSNTDPPDTFEKECSWCGTDGRPTAFCSKACEDASHEANVEPNDDGDTDQRYAVREHERDLALLRRAGLALLRRAGL